MPTLAFHRALGYNTLKAKNKANEGRYDMIISCSRRTDIPAFFAPWFQKRVQQGYVYTKNPINPKQMRKLVLDPKVVDMIVFWTKNAIPMMPVLDELDNRGYKYYFQYTITPYGKEIEPEVPNKEEIIHNFIALSNRLGKNRVIWRYDPIFINETYTIEYHIEQFKEMYEQLKNYTNRIVISFIDLYKKTKKNTQEYITRELNKQEVERIAAAFSSITKQDNITLGTCSEEYDLTAFGIEPTSCISKKVIEEILGCKIKTKKDRAQRQSCNCIESIDIGKYDTCQHGCIYCYATNRLQKVLKNQEIYDEDSPILSEKLEEDIAYTITEQESIKINEQISLF